MPFDPPTRSLVFLHIPKTGGTSATTALRQCFAEAVTNGDGNLSVASFGRGPGGRGVLFHGHPEHGAAWAIPPDAVTATLLRAPEAQAVSNYLHLLRNPQLPWHEPAVRLGLAKLMAARWQFLAFQAISLDVAVSHDSIEVPQQFFDRLPGIRRFLARIDVVGHLDHLDGFLAEAVRRTGRATPALPAPCLNTAAGFAVDRREVERLGEEYRALAADPFLRRIMEAEASVVAQAAAQANPARSGLLARAVHSAAAGWAVRRDQFGTRWWPQTALPPGPVA